MLEGLRVAVLVERGTNPTEFQYSRLRLKEAGAAVLVVGNYELEVALEDHSRARADVTASQVADQPFDAVVIPGGLGPEKLRQNSQVLELVRDAYDRGKVIAILAYGLNPGKRKVLEFALYPAAPSRDDWAGYAEQLVEDREVAEQLGLGERREVSMSLRRVRRVLG